MTRLLLALAIPTALWLCGRAAAGGTSGRPAIATATCVTACAPPLGVAWFGRSFLEQAAAWVVAIVGWGGLLVGRDPQVLAATALVGAAWGFILAMSEAGAAVARPAPAEVPPRPPPPPVVRPSDDTQDDHAFRIELSCPKCGAAVLLPVYHRMAACTYCGSSHLVNRSEEPLVTVIPDAVGSEGQVLDAVVRHLRRRRYLELYDRRVRPLVERHAAGVEAGELRVVPAAAGDVGTGVPAIVNAAEESVNRAADRFAAKLRPHLRLLSWQRFLSPYWHRGGLLYQVAFGRDREAAKRMELSITYQEASLPACEMPLPEMGKLSYLRALRPLLGSPEAAIPRVPPSIGRDALARRMAALERRAADLPITVITCRGTFVPDVEALVWRPWHTVEVAVRGERRGFLLDGGAGAVAGGPVAVTAVEENSPTPEPMALTPSRCPECGAELPFVPDALAHLCTNCFRLIEHGDGRWKSMRYRCEPPRAGHWSVPFWLFPLRLRTAEGRLVTDLRHLGDGIDGTLDQLGDTPQRQSFVYVPAFRLQLNRAAIRFYRTLWPRLQITPPRLQEDRFTPTSGPEHAVPITLDRREARAFATILLALTFTARDLARAEIRGVRARFLDSELEGEPAVVFRTLPADLFAPYRALLAPTRATAVMALQGDASR